jgi:hypothetical protein
MIQVIFSSPGQDDVPYGPYEAVRVGFGEIFAQTNTEEGEVMVAKAYGNLSHTSPNGIIVTDGITVTGADRVGADLVGWVPEGSSIAYLYATINDDTGSGE